MRPAWTAEAVSLMHLYAIKAYEVAEKAEYSRPYLSMVLNGTENPPGGRDRVMTAIHQLIIAKVAQEQTNIADD